MFFINHAAVRVNMHIESEACTMTRRQAREQAFMILFEKSFHPETEVEEILDVNVKNGIMEDDEFVKLLIKTTWDKLAEIDAVIEKNSIGWRISRISKVSLAVLRLSLCEILYISEVPVGVSINEAVELCKKFADEEDAPFVNGILGSVARSLESGSNPDTQGKSEP